ncbi:hypothetical protein KR038_010305 [Drosophila bunnanda]|nr:hypothetical protein KR038_010305 [Drosophila bunnanda]
MLPRPGGSGKSKDDSSMAAALEVVIVHSPASKEQRLIGGQETSSSCCRRKQRNNATQTRSDGGSCCCVITTHHHHCHCHRHHHHHHHHCHYRSTKRRALLHQKRSHSHHRHNHNQHMPIKQMNPNQMLPMNNNNNNNKSSLDSSEEGMHHHHHQAIAIEIDAATMSEDCDENNSSTATSNFPYKVASEGVKPIIMAPLREQHRHRRGSLNSNTTIETDELSHDDDDDDVRMGSHHLPEDETQLTQPPNTSSSSSTKRGNPASAPARNECVRIKRKRFMAEAGQDYCSSCSSSCSCSSLDEDHLEGQVHEMTVSAECHECRRGSFCSCHNSSCCCGSGSQEEEEDEEDEEEEADDEDDDETTGQRESFCTAADHTITPSQEGEDMHSSTLTPLSTHRSSFMDHADHTMRSDDNGGGNLTDADASSLSQSAEYFSLSSTAGGATTSYPIKEEKPKDSKEREVDTQPSCKHLNPRNPHSRHKRAASPVDSSL